MMPMRDDNTRRSATFAAATLLALLLSPAALGTHAMAACLAARVAGPVSVDICSDGSSVSWTSRVLGAPVTSGYARRGFQAESGAVYQDETLAVFSVPTTNFVYPAIKVRVRVLLSDRSDNTIFSEAGDTILEWSYWNQVEYVDCPVPRYDDLGNHCWDGATSWIKVGQL